MSDRDHHLPRTWLDAIERPPVLAALEGVYDAAAREIAARGPACWASGRCCNFESAGHRLYVTGLEAAYVLASRGEPGQQPGQGDTAPARHVPGKATLSLHQLSDARAAGGCPFQQGNLCGVHEIKPLGCRVYFCDRSAQEWQHDLSERLMSAIRAIHDEHAIEYRYAEWRDMLERCLCA